MHPQSSRWPNGGFVLAFAALALATLGLCLWTVVHLKDAAVAAVLHGRPPGRSTFAPVLGPADLALAASALAAAALLVRRRRLAARFLATATPAEAFTVLTILTAWSGQAYLVPGLLLGGDTATHIARFLEVRRGLDAGVLPTWTNFQYMGEPLLWFTGPLIYVVGGALSWLLRDPTLAAKTLLFALHMASGWLFFAFARRLGTGVIAAMVIAAAFAGCFAHLHLFLYRGVFPQAFTIAFLVALFLAADGLLRGIGARWANAALFALCTAGLIVNHQPHALFAAFYLGLFGVVALALGFWRRDNLPVLLAAGLLGVAASLVAVVPAMAEADWVMIEADRFPFHLHLPTAARLLHLVLWRDTRTTWGTDYWAYLGIGLVGFALAGLLALARGRLGRRPRAATLAASACLAVCFFLYNQVVRDILFLMFFAAIIAAAGLDHLIQRGLPAGRLLLVLAAVLLDLASTSVQPVARTDKGFLLAAGQALQRETPGHRVIELGLDGNGRLAGADTGPDADPTSYAATYQRIAGNHNMAATRVHNFAIALVKRAEADLRSAAALQPRTQALLALFNVGRLICTSPVAAGCPAAIANAGPDPALGRTLAVPGATPVVFSQSLAAIAIDPALEKPMLWPTDFDATPQEERITRIDTALDRVLAAEDIDFATRRARAIAIHADTAPPPAPAVTPPATIPPVPWQPALLRYDVGLRRVRLDMSADACGYAQLAHPWFPSTAVTVNGRAVRPIRGALNFMVVPVCAGRSEIVLRPASTPVRRASALVSLLGLLSIAAGAAWLARHDRRSARGRSTGACPAGTLSPGT